MKAFWDDGAKRAAFDGALPSEEEMEEMKAVLKGMGEGGSIPVQFAVHSTMTLLALTERLTKMEAVLTNMLLLLAKEMPPDGEFAKAVREADEAAKREAK